MSSSITSFQQQIDNEVLRATESEGVLQAAIDAEVQNRENAILEISISQGVDFEAQKSALNIFATAQNEARSSNFEIINQQIKTQSNSLTSQINQINTDIEILSQNVQENTINENIILSQISSIQTSIQSFQTQLQTLINQQNQLEQDIQAL